MKDYEIKEVCGYKYNGKFYDTKEEVELQKAEELLDKAKKYFIDYHRNDILKEIDNDITYHTFSDPNLLGMKKDKYILANREEVYTDILYSILRNPTYWNEFLKEYAKHHERYYKVKNIKSKNPWWKLW